MRYPSLQSDGTSSFSQFFVKRGENSSTDVSMSVLSASAGVSPGDAALFFFSALWPSDFFLGMFVTFDG